MTNEITTLAGISRHWADRAPDRIALTAGDRTWTFAELDETTRTSEKVWVRSTEIGYAGRLDSSNRTRFSRRTCICSGRSSAASAWSAGWSVMGERLSGPL